jgi:hypothetical protein
MSWREPEPSPRAAARITDRHDHGAVREHQRVEDALWLRWLLSGCRELPDGATFHDVLPVRGVAWQPSRIAPARPPPYWIRIFIGNPWQISDLGLYEQLHVSP